MSVGYVKMYRALGDSDLWLAEPFTKGQAWADLILNANFRDRTAHIAGQQIPVNRGQLAWSEVTLSKRWKWSRGKVRRFLNLLKNDDKIEQQSVQHTSLITICNYEKFQGIDGLDGTPDETPNGTPDRTPNDTPDGTQEEKVNKVKKVKKGSQETTLPDDFHVTEAMKTWFTEKGFTIDMVQATDRWKDAMLAKGRTYKDWSAAWRNGMKLAQGWHDQRRENIQPVQSRAPAHTGKHKPFPGINHAPLPTGTGGDA